LLVGDFINRYWHSLVSTEISLGILTTNIHHSRFPLAARPTRSGTRVEGWFGWLSTTVGDTHECRNWAFIHPRWNWGCSSLTPSIDSGVCGYGSEKRDHSGSSVAAFSNASMTRFYGFRPAAWGVDHPMRPRNRAARRGANKRAASPSGSRLPWKRSKSAAISFQLRSKAKRPSKSS